MVRLTPSRRTALSMPRHPSRRHRSAAAAGRGADAKGKKLRVGDRFHLETSEPVMVQGVNVIPVGSPAMGEITDVRNKGMWGKSGHLSARICTSPSTAGRFGLSGAFDDKGVAGGVGAVAVSAIVFAPAGFFMRHQRQGRGGIDHQELRDEDVPLSMPAAAEAPMAVGASAH